MTYDSIILVGASVRAAAQSAVRAGMKPWCADLFCDQDLQTIAPARRVRSYPSGLVAALAGAPCAPLIYTGALENYPSLIDALTKRRRLWGNAGEVLRGVRDPLQVEAALRRRGLSAPSVRAAPTAIPRDGRWLCKPLRSGGGWRIHLWDDALPPPVRTAEADQRGRQRGGCYFQERVDGHSCAALFVAAKGTAILLGIARQLVGTAWTGAKPFCYAGSIGPDQLSPPCETAFCRIGECLADAFRLEGLFGVDAIINDQGVWPVEVNPRYPASAEILERAGGFSAIQIHADACASGHLPKPPLPPHRCFAGKAIVFAAADFQVTQPLADWIQRENQGSVWPTVADVPRLGSHIAQGSPILTVLCEATEPLQVETILRQRIAVVRSLCEQ